MEECMSNPPSEEELELMFGDLVLKYGEARVEKSLIKSHPHLSPEIIKSCVKSFGPEASQGTIDAARSSLNPSLSLAIKKEVVGEVNGAVALGHPPNTCSEGASLKLGGIGPCAGFKASHSRTCADGSGSHLRGKDLAHEGGTVEGISEPDLEGVKVPSTDREDDLLLLSQDGTFSSDLHLLSTSVQDSVLHTAKMAALEHHGDAAAAFSWADCVEVEDGGESSDDESMAPARLKMNTVEESGKNTKAQLVEQYALAPDLELRDHSNKQGAILNRQWSETVKVRTQIKTGPTTPSFSIGPISQSEPHGTSDLGGSKLEGDASLTTGCGGEDTAGAISTLGETHNSGLKRCDNKQGSHEQVGTQNRMAMVAAVVDPLKEKGEDEDRFRLNKGEPQQRKPSKVGPGSLTDLGACGSNSLPGSNGSSAGPVLIGTEMGSGRSSKELGTDRVLNPKENNLGHNGVTDGLASHTTLGVSLTDSSLISPQDSTVHSEKSWVQVINGVEAKSSTWTETLGRKSVGKEELEFVPPTMVDGKAVVHIKSDEFENAKLKFGKLVVGSFVGRRLPYNLVKETCQRTWKLKNEFAMDAQGDKMYVFEFKDDEDRCTVLDIGTFHIASNLFIVRPWKLFIETESTKLKTIPIWVILRNFPMELWNRDGFSKVGSAIGRPLFTDKRTEEPRRNKFARLCIEIDTKCMFPTVVPVIVDDTRIIPISVEYSWRPPLCKHCDVFGHIEAVCPALSKNEKQHHNSHNVWIQTKGTTKDKQHSPSPPSTVTPTQEVVVMSAVMEHQITNSQPTLKGICNNDDGSVKVVMNVEEGWERPKKKHTIKYGKINSMTRYKQQDEGANFAEQHDALFPPLVPSITNVNVIGKKLATDANPKLLHPP